MASMAFDKLETMPYVFDPSYCGASLHLLTMDLLGG